MKIMKIILLSLLMPFSILAQNITLKEGFVAAHTEMLMDSTIDPLNTLLNANVSMNKNDILSLKGKFWIQMNQFSSDNKDRDTQMHKANKVKEFPLASFTLMDVTKNKDSTYTLKGKLTFLDHTRPFQAKAEITDKDGLVSISASSQIFAKDFGLEMPCLLFICVNEKIDLYVKAVFTTELTY
ncbi:YceI family protein [Sulfurimonas sp. MAG313]|nr:YceI family protein [Sulfurimonas sp. MAG313]MDF1880201.1 YceI family protein [Sulfurimonas sp. MAG313]